VANHYRPSELALAFRANASGYFVNVNSCDAFIKSIELVAMGETVFPSAFLSFALDTKSDDGSKAAPPDDSERGKSPRCGLDRAHPFPARLRGVLLRRKTPARPARSRI
jgi:DNA-binding NarL/FixJ family response regulator